MSYTERAAKYICYFAYGAVIYLFLKYGLAAALPFIISFLVASFAEKAANKLSAATRINRRVYSALILLIILILLITLTSAIIGRLLYEAREFVNEYISDPSKLEKILYNASRISESLTVKLNLPPSVRSSLGKTVDNEIGRISDIVISKIGEILEKTVAYVISGAPSWILFVTVTIISAFYFGCTRCARDPIIRKLSSDNRKKLLRLKSGIISTVGKYARAYLTIFSISTAVLFCGFSIIGIKYAFLVALLVAMLDMLPVIGLSTVMIPWSLIELARGNAGIGFALLAIFAVTVLIREAVEPKIIGKCIGANPLITLIAMYTGLKLFGIKGVIALPIIISGAITYLSEKEHSTAIKKPPITKRNDINSAGIGK